MDLFFNIVAFRASGWFNIVAFRASRWTEALFSFILKSIIYVISPYGFNRIASSLLDAFFFNLPRLIALKRPRLIER
jgi:hypothetical protein